MLLPVSLAMYDGEAVVRRQMQRCCSTMPVAVVAAVKVVAAAAAVDYEDGIQWRWWGECSMVAFNGDGDGLRVADEVLPSNQHLIRVSFISSGHLPNRVRSHSSEKLRSIDV